MIKLCFITATRAEYGLLKWLMREVQVAEEFQLQLLVTGTHLMYEHGHTIDCIRNDGFIIDEELDIHLDNSSPESIASSMGKLAQAITPVFTKLDPDYVVVCGDRYELLPIVSTAFIMRIPVIHISGGDVTEGAIDDGIRNAITMLADYHFPGTQESADRIVRMRGSDRRVWAVGEPGLDSFNKEPIMDRIELSKSIGLEPDNQWVLFTYHPETKKSLKYNIDAVKTCIESLLNIEGVQIVATNSNADCGGAEINNLLDEIADLNPQRIVRVPSLGNKRYLSIMRQVLFIIGNSSSGIVEAPSLGVPVINVGYRQKGRYMCKNIVQTDTGLQSITAAIAEAMSMRRDNYDDYWGDGHTAERIIRILTGELRND